MVLGIIPDPDWQVHYTAKQAEVELQGFHFSGPGWYSVSESDILLVVPEADVEYTGSYRDAWLKSPWRQSWPSEQTFLFMYYSDKASVLASLNAIANAPTRS